MGNRFHDLLKIKVDELAHLVYKLTKSFPKEEIFGVISQMRRAALSVALNYIEGFARGKDRRVHLNFLHISYGSLKELKYLLYFCFKEKYIQESEYAEAIKLSEEIGAMLWKTISGFK